MRLVDAPAMGRPVRLIGASGAGSVPNRRARSARSSSRTRRSPSPPPVEADDPGVPVGDPQVRAVTNRIQGRLAEHPDAVIFLSFPGMGEVTAATMLAEMGEDRSRFPTADVLLAETGTGTSDAS